MRPLTGSGIGVAVAAVLFLLAGWGLDYPELVALGLACVLVLLIAVGWMLARPDLTVERVISPVRITEGESAQGVLTATNAGSRRSPPVVAEERVGNRTVRVALPSLAAGASYTVTYPLETDRRGVHEVGPLTVGHADPLGLVAALQDFPSQSRLWVRPRAEAVVPVPMGRSRDMEGPTSSSAPRGGITFHSLREYEPGDDLRLIHWPSTARTGELMVRHNVLPSVSRVLIALDTRASDYTAPEDFEEAVRVTASLSLASLARGFPLELRTTAGDLVTVADRRVTGRQAMMDLLTAVTRGDDLGIVRLVHQGLQDRDATLVVVTGSSESTDLDGVQELRRRFAGVHLVQLGGGAGARVASRDHVVASDLTDFAARWNTVVPR